MTCKCVDEKGKLLDNCIGTCMYSEGVIIPDKNYRNEIQIMMDAIIDRVDKKIDLALKYQRVEFSADQLIVYKQGFKEGVELGLQMGKEYY